MAAHLANFLEVLVDPVDANVDLVAVHGLNPKSSEFHARQTWTSDKSKRLWLSDADFLPKQFPKVRVMLFGYNSNVAFKTSTAGVREQAENLLNRLKLERKGIAKDRPIIFICHSLGGIVVKRALVESKLNDLYDPIRTATYGIVFFATPHRGGNHAKLGDIVASIVKKTLRNQDNTFLEALKKDSLFADGNSGDFRHQQEDFVVLSFYETLSYKSIGVIVDKKSATLGLSGKHERQVAMAADHSSICKFEDPEGSDYKQVIGNLQDLVEGAIDAVQERQRLQDLIVSTDSLSLNKRFLCPYVKNDNFIGRESIIEEVKRKLGLGKLLNDTTQSSSNSFNSQAAVSNCSSNSVVSLWGVGGVGKSQIAIAYIYWLHQQQGETFVFWIHGATVDRFRQGYLEIARHCQIPRYQEADVDILQLVRDWLQGKGNGTWLMVIDNADNVEDFFKSNSNKSQEENPLESMAQTKLQPYIPVCNHGSVLVTTRSKEVAIKFGSSGLIEVPEMSESESEDLVQTLLRGEDFDGQDAKELVNTLHHLPLAISQAAAYIKEMSSSVRRYLHNYHESESSALEILDWVFESEGRDQDCANAVVTTWMISFDQIRRHLPRAADLLSLMAFFDRQDIPESLLKDQDETLVDFDIAIGKLKAFALVTTNSTSKHFDEHRLAHLISLAWLRQTANEGKWLANAQKRILDRFPKEAYKDWDTCAAYLPHARAIIDRELEDTSGTYNESIYMILYNVGEYLLHRGSYSSAMELCKDAHGYCLRHLGAEHPSTLTSMNNLALLLNNLRKYEEAEPISRQTLLLREKVLGREHSSTLLSMHNLALLLRNLGKYDEAETLYRQTLQLREEVFGKEHPNTLTSMNGLATLLHAQGKFKEAESLYRQTLQLREKVLGQEHPNTLTSMSYLASVLDTQGKYDESEQMSRQTLQLREKVLGLEHPKTLMSMADLVNVLNNLGKYEEAEPVARQTLQLREKVLGMEHPDTVLSMNNLAFILCDLGKYEEAEPRYRKTLQIREKVLGMEHPDTVLSMNNLASLLFDLRKYEEAEPIDRKILQLREKVLGREHPSTLTSMNNLAILLHTQGMYTEAEMIYHQTIQLREKAIGTEHPDTLGSRENLATLLQNQGKFVEAEQLSLGNDLVQ